MATAVILGYLAAMSMRQLQSQYLGRSLFSGVPGYIAALAFVGLTTMVAAIVEQAAPVTHVSMFFLLPVLGTALRWGLGPSLFAAALSIGCCSLFYAPVFSFQVNAPSDIADLFVFAFIALIAGPAADNLRTKVANLRRQEHEFRDLYALGREVMAAGSLTEIYQAIIRHLSEIVGRPVEVQMIGDEPLLGAKPQQDRLIAQTLAREISVDGLHSSRLIALPDGRRLLCRGLQISDRNLAVLLVDVSGSSDLDEERAQHALSILEDGAASFERFGIAAAIEEGRMRAKTDELRDMLISTVSHDLRTPLAGIMGAATVLQGADKVAQDPRLSGLARLMQEESERLDQIIQTLLDATRIRAGSLYPKLDWVEVPDLLQSVLHRCRQRLKEHRVKVTIAPDLPLLQIDPALAAQALTNLLDNASKYAPIGTVIAVSARQEQENVVLAVIDQGSGFPQDEALHLFEAFYRGDRSDVPGTGLGLAIARVFIETNKGTITASSAGEGQGTRIEVRFPVTAPPQRDEDLDEEP
ncbi:ATP-binding protein [Lacibacterium aquatile]|uniref:histidine kinase n=1 Tax=Lacibacterium aquatile TaxID=1168082 RepID=A0ABW5DP64_9PROT